MYYNKIQTIFRIEKDLQHKSISITIYHETYEHNLANKYMKKR